MISVDEAWQRIADRACPVETTRLGLEEALGRVLAADVVASIDLPPFDNSAMDGYALRSADTLSATEADPVRIAMRETIAAGVAPGDPVVPGTCVRIMTGAPLPGGADAVLQLENARLRDDVVEVRSPVPPGRHIRRQAEDVRRGELMAARGTELTTNVAGLLANAGTSDVDVHRAVRVAIIATGRELVTARSGAELQPGQIYDSNGIVMRAMARDAGCDVTDLGIVADDPDLIQERIELGIDADVLLLSGGVSVGRYDFVKDVLKSLGMERIFWRVKMKPGKPLLCGRIGATWVFGLPGNPISCVAGFAVFVAPLIRALQGHPVATAQYQKARLTHGFSHDASRRLLATAWVARDELGQLAATPTAKQGSAMMQSLARSNGFVVIPEDVPQLDEGAVVDVLTI